MYTSDVYQNGIFDFLRIHFIHIARCIAEMTRLIIFSQFSFLSTDCISWFEIVFNLIFHVFRFQMSSEIRYTDKNIKLNLGLVIWLMHRNDTKKLNVSITSRYFNYARVYNFMGILACKIDYSQFFCWTVTFSIFVNFRYKIWWKEIAIR